MARTKSWLLVCVLCLSVAVGSVPAAAVTDPGVGAGQQYDADESGSLQEQRVNVTRGDTATIAVTHSDSASLTVRDPDGSFLVTVELSGSGTSEVEFDTYETAARNPDEFVSGGDATLYSAPLDDPIAAGTYVTQLEVNGDEKDLGTLTVEPLTTSSAEFYRAPASFTPAEYISGEQDGSADVGALESTMTNGSTVARGDYAVIRVEADGLGNALNAYDLRGRHGANGVKVVFTSAATDAEQRPEEVYLATHSADVSVMSDFDDDEIYFVWNTTHAGLNSPAELNEYRAEVRLTRFNALVDSETMFATTTFRIQEPTVSVSTDDDGIHYPWENDTVAVTGESNLAPGTDLEVRLRSPEGEAFLETRDVTVGENGTFATDFEFGALPHGQNATLWVRDHYGETVRDVRLAAPAPAVAIRNQTTDGRAVTVRNVVVPDGGYVQLVGTNGTTLGRSAYLEPGVYETVTAETESLAGSRTVRAELLHPGTDDAYDANADPYLDDESVVSDAARISVSTPTATPAVGTTRNATQATETATGTPYPVATRTPLGPQQAGPSLPIPFLGGVGVAAGAGALVAWRRWG